MKRIKITSQLPPRIRHTGPAEALVAPQFVVAALEGESIGSIPSDSSPPTFLALRQEIANRLASTGGRPALEGTARRQKIPLNEEDWSRLRKLADRVAEDGLHPTPGQVASALLRISLANIDLAAAQLRVGQAIPDLLWTQREAPTGERLLTFVAQIKTFTITESTQPVPEETTKRLYKSLAESLETELDQVAA